MSEPHQQRKARLTARRKRVWERDGGVCFYCKKPVSLREIELDHVIAKSRGGGPDDINRAASCKRCNATKGSLSLMDWILKVESRLVQARADVIYFSTIRESLKHLD